MTASFLSSTEKRNGIKKHTIANDVEKQKLLTQKKNGWGWGVGWTMEAFSPPVSNDVPKFVIPSYASLFLSHFFLSLQKNLIRHNLSKNVALIRGQPRSSGRVCVKLGEIEIPLPNQSTKMYFLFR